MTQSRSLAFAQLLRLPNVFTAFADIALAGCVVGLFSDNALTLLLLWAASGSLYLGGMVWNDVFDRAEDARDRPFRPIPSGRVKLRTAIVLGIILLLMGIGFAAWTTAVSQGFQRTVNPLSVAITLALAILFYDGYLKQTPFGPVGMGCCRSLNVLMGLATVNLLSLPEGLPWHLAGVIGLYIVGVTWFARTEERVSQKWPLMLAATVIGLSLVLGLFIPLHFPPDTAPIYFPYLLILFGTVIGVSLVRAIRVPEPKNVQAAIKRCILGLVVLDAVLATAFVGWPGLLIVLLLPPGLLLGKWVYST